MKKTTELKGKTTVGKSERLTARNWPAQRIPVHGPNLETSLMLNWSITFFIIAIIAAVLGFSGIAGSAAGIAQILFSIFLILFVVSAISRAIQGKRV